MTPLAMLLLDLDIMADRAEELGNYAGAKAVRDAVRAIERSPSSFLPPSPRRVRAAPGKRCSAKQMVLRHHPAARCLRQGGDLLFAVYLKPDDQIPVVRANGAQESWALAAQQILAPAPVMAEAREKGLA